MTKSCITKSLSMGYKTIRIVLEIDDQVVTERMIEKRAYLIEEIRTRWMHTYALKSRKRPYMIYVQVPSNMSPRKFKKTKQHYINSYD